MSSPKPSVSLIDFKKKFTKIVDTLENNFKSNTSAYKQKFYQLYTKKCFEVITIQKSESLKQSGFQQQIQQGNLNKMGDCQIDPFSVIQYFREFCDSITSYYIALKEKQKTIKKQINDLFSMGMSSNFLETLAKKNLQNYDLYLKVEQLETSLKFKATECKLAEKTTVQYQKKFKQFQKDFNTVVIAISNILKQSQLSEIQLKQQNRLQKELIQSHKIEFQRFKQDFKLKPSQADKINKIKRLLQKKYNDRQEIIIKQSQKIAEQRLKNKIIDNKIK